MTETRKESLSALIDGEASELEVHRLLREFRSDDSLTQSWMFYQHIRSTLQPRQEPAKLSPAHHLSLFERISSAVDEETGHDTVPLRQGPPVKVVAGSLALAAALVVAVMIGVQQPESGQPGGSLAVQTTAAERVNAPPVQTVMNSVEGEVTPELVELDEEKQRRLRAYLNQHDRMARMTDNRQLVNFKESPGN